MKKILLIVLTLCATTKLFAQTFNYNGIDYNVTSSTTVEVGDNRTFVGAAVIQSSVTNANITYEVTSIADNAFTNCIGLTSVNIPNSIKNIGNYAFAKCLGLTSLKFPEQLNLLGVGVFSQCYGLASVFIPFSNNIFFQGSNDFIPVVGNIPLGFETDINDCQYFGSNTQAKILYTDTNIYNGRFAYCPSISSVIIPNSVKTIGIGAFTFCKILKSVYIPSSVSNIGARAFHNCTDLKSVTVGWTTPLPLDSLIFGNTNIASATLYVPAGTLAAYKAAPVWKDFGTIIEKISLKFTDIGINYKITSLTTVEVGLNPDFTGAAVIPNSVFYDGLTYKVTSIGDSAFSNNTSSNILKSISIPNSVTTIGKNAFARCNGLISLNIPSSVTTIGSQAFSFCGNLINLNIPNSVTSIGSRAFEYCTSFTSISIPNSITDISDGVFSYCTKLTSINIPNSVTNIGEYVFSNCRGLKTINIPTSVKSIGNWAFQSCANLLDINLPNTVNNIGNNAFESCGRLASVNISNSVKTIGMETFQNCFKLTSVNIPNSVETIGNRAFYNCSALPSVIIPKSVISIGINAFQYCSVLTNITVNWTKPLSINANIFDNVPIASDTLYVPSGTFTAYNTAPVWKIFGTIIEMPPVTFTHNGINFKATSPTTIEITATPSFTGVLNIPNRITYEGIIYDVTSIANNAFAGTDITTINIPSTVINIGDYAFANLTSLITVNINWTTPLVINANVFGDVPIVIGKMREPSKTILANTNITSATLYVLAGTLAAYKAAPVWKDFGTILEQFPLPLTLTSFTAKAIAIGNQINWATANVVNVKSIIVERSGADKIFTAIASLPITAIQFIDTAPLPGDNYYRLGTIDNDGSPITYSKIAFVKGLTNDVSLYPNPVTNGLLNVVAGSAKIYSVAMFNLNGKKVVFVNTKNSTNKVAVSTQGLVKGVYILEINNEKGKTIKKVVVN